MSEDRRPCRCDLSGCHPCWLYANVPAIRVRWESPSTPSPPRPPTPVAVPARPARCRHLGPVLAECPAGDPNRDLRRCAVHGQCTFKTSDRMVMTCDRCYTRGLGYAPGGADGPA